MPEATIDALAGRVGELTKAGNEPSPHTVASYERCWRQGQRFADRHGIAVNLAAAVGFMFVYGVGRSGRLDAASHDCP